MLNYVVLIRVSLEGRKLVLASLGKACPTTEVQWDRVCQPGQAVRAVHQHGHPQRRAEAGVVRGNQARPLRESSKNPTLRLTAERWFLSGWV